MIKRKSFILSSLIALFAIVIIILSGVLLVDDNKYLNKLSPNLEEYDGPSVIPVSFVEGQSQSESILLAIQANYLPRFYTRSSGSIFLCGRYVWKTSPFQSGLDVADFMELFPAKLGDYYDRVSNFNEFVSLIGSDLSAESFQRFAIVDEERSGVTLFLSPVINLDTGESLIGIGHKIIDGHGSIDDERFILYKIMRPSGSKFSLIPVAVIFS